MILFAGPSLAGVHVSSMKGIDQRPPVRQGDVYLATLEQPSAIGIIDGYFEGVPSVWHKEILWAMSQGITVLGASSMGALRAAELDTFGMIGIGSIYRAYRDGQLEDDDEVALVHGPQELGYHALSVAMVNVRATCDAAEQAGVLSNAQAEHVVARAKTQFFKIRTWDSILQDLSLQHVPRDVCQQLRGWIEKHEVDQKREDARALLDCMQRGEFVAPSADFHFEKTDLWVHSTVAWRRDRRQEKESPKEGYRLLGNSDTFG